MLRKEKREKGNEKGLGYEETELDKKQKERE